MHINILKSRSAMMRKIIASLNISLDGFIEGANGEIDWIDSWDGLDDMVSQFDTCLLGATMYPGYEQYWTAVRDAPQEPLPFSGLKATAGEMQYAEFAYSTPHIVLSSQLQSAAWSNSKIVRSLHEVVELKERNGRSIYAVGGAALVGSLINANLLDEVRVMVRPILLGGGKALFKDVVGRHRLKLVSSTTLAHGLVGMNYTIDV
jgi:dihydrofolate reductase